MSKPRIVIVGGGFAGLAAARSIGPRYDVTLVDAKPDFEFIPNLHELVSRVKKPGMLTIGHGLLERLGHQFVCDQVVSVDPGWKAVVTRSGQRLEADALILAPGSGAAHTQTPGVTQHALQLRSVEAGGLIADRVEDCAAAARPGHPVYITVIGGGYTGVEVLGEVLRIHLAVILADERLSLGDFFSIRRRFSEQRHQFFNDFCVCVFCLE